MISKDLAMSINRNFDINLIKVGEGHFLFKDGIITLRLIDDRLTGSVYVWLFQVFRGVSIDRTFDNFQEVYFLLNDILEDYRKGTD